MRKFAAIFAACSIVLAAGFSAAQQVDLTIGGSTLMSSTPKSDVVGFHTQAEKGGTYISISGDFVGFRKRRLGLNVETAWRYRQATYPFNGETYRPILTDVNLLFQPRLSKKMGLDLMGGVGIASTRFTLPSTASCVATGCINYTSSNHFMEDLGAGVRYYVWRHVFVRPEIHYYRIQNNREFNSDNVFRVGASIGYTFGND